MNILLPDGLKAEFALIAKECFNIDTLEERRSDSLDFHNVAVWEIEKALVRAYWLGQSRQFR